MTEAPAKVCEECSTSITADQIIHRQAGLVHGVLLCPACVEKKRKEAIAAAKAAESNIEIIEGDSPAAPSAAQASTKIRSFAADSTLGGAHHDDHLKRPLSGTMEPPTRIRNFHSKLTPGAISHMDEQINEWLDKNPGVFIKHSHTTVGPFEAKHVEQHLIVTIFY